MSTDTFTLSLFSIGAVHDSYNVHRRFFRTGLARGPELDMPLSVVCCRLSPLGGSLAFVAGCVFVIWMLRTHQWQAIITSLSFYRLGHYV